MSLPILLSTALVGVLLVMGLGTHRAFARNARRECAHCARKLPIDEQYRVDGLLVCPRCAERTRRRLGGAAWVYVGLSVLGVGFCVGLSVLGWLDGEGFSPVGPVVGGGIAALFLLLWLLSARAMRSSNWSGERMDRALDIPSAEEFARIQRALDASGIPPCEEQARFFPRLRQLRWWNARKLAREMEDHAASCEVCLARAAIAEAARIHLRAI